MNSICHFNSKDRSMTQSVEKLDAAATASMVLLLPDHDVEENQDGDVCSKEGEKELLEEEMATALLGLGKDTSENVRRKLFFIILSQDTHSA